jgi:hypothetical protein
VVWETVRQLKNLIKELFEEFDDIMERNDISSSNEHRKLIV